MFNHDALKDIHAFEARGHKLAFNGNTYDITVLDNGEYDVFSRGLAGARLNVEEINFFETTCNSLMASSPKRNTTQTVSSNSYISSFIGSLCLNVTSRCNIKCNYCFNNQGAYDFEAHQVMSEKTARNAIDFLISRCEGYCDVSFFGGEPLTQFPLIKNTVEYAEVRSANEGVNISFHVTTNGILITPEIVHFLKQHNFSVIVSLDGNQKTHDNQRQFANGRGTYRKVMKGVETLLDIYGSQEKILIRGTYTHQQLDFVDSFLHFIDNGFENISIEPATGKEFEEHSVKLEDIKTLTQAYGCLAEKYRQVRNKFPNFNFFHLTEPIAKLSRGKMVDRPCGAANGYMAVAPDGGLYPCHRIMNEKYKIGNVNDVACGLGLNVEVRNLFGRATTNNKPTCQECWARNLCGGSCHAFSIENGRSVFEPVEIECELVKLRAELAISLLVDERQSEGRGKLGLIQASGRSLSCSMSCEQSCQTNCERSLQCGSCGSGCMAGCQSGCTSSCAVRGGE